MTDKFYGNGFVSREDDVKISLQEASPEDRAVYQRIAENYFHNLHGKTNFEKVREFMTAMGQQAPPKPVIVAEGIANLRLALIDEELNEFAAGQQNEDLVAIADAIADLLYVVYGAAVAYGIDIDRCFNEVHRSNMSKFGDDMKPLLRDDGKVLKGPKYSPPDLKPILFPDLPPEDLR